MKQDNDICKCACGYTWKRGFSGHHYCEPQYQATIASLEAERDAVLNTCSLIAGALGITGAVAGDTIARVQQLVSENAELKTNARDVAINAANNIAYAIFNLSGKTLDDLKQGVSETTCPTDSALIAERDLRQFAARMSKSLPPRLTEEEMQELAHGTIESFVNACHCKNKDDILLALSFLLSGGLSAGETVKHGEMAVLQ
ncbi:hypothetical protein WFO69_16720 [Yersinia enterocolitica]